MIFLDTHVLVWLYGGMINKFSSEVQQQLENNSLLISPMVELELDFLFEIKRTTVSGVEIVRYLNAHLGVNIAKIDFYQVIEAAQHLTWTRDPFDRLIVAHASIFQAPIITKDEKIHRHYPSVIW